MTDEINNEAPQLSEVEQRAMEMGWRPKEEFDGDEVDFIDAKEFVARKPLYDKISQQSKELKSVRTAIDALKEHYTKVKETEYQRAIADLRNERKRAFQDMDADRVAEIEDQIKHAQTEFETIKQEAQAIKVESQEVHPEFSNFLSRNPWYQSTKYMREWADETGQRLAATMSPNEVLKEVEKLVRKEFPHKFTNPNKENAPDVSTSSGKGRSAKAEYQMTEQEHRIWQTLHRMDPEKFSKEKYVADLKKVKGI